MPVMTEPRKWGRIAAVTMLVGGFADASLARPQVPGPLDLWLLATGFASILGFLALADVTRTSVGFATSIAMAAVVGLGIAASRGLTGAEIVIASLDGALRLGLVVALVILWRHHLTDAAGSGRERERGAARP